MFLKTYIIFLKVQKELLEAENAFGSKIFPIKIGGISFSDKVPENSNFKKSNPK